MKEDCFGSRNGMHGEIVQCSRKNAHSTGGKIISANKKETLSARLRVIHINWSHQGFVIIPKGGLCFLLTNATHSVKITQSSVTTCHLGRNETQLNQL